MAIDYEKCKVCSSAIGNVNKPKELGCTKTFYWVQVQFMDECPKEKDKQKKKEYRR